MDNDNLLLLDITSRFQLELNEVEELLDRAQFLTTLLIIGSNEDHMWSMENRHPRCQYLGRLNLLPDPRTGTP